MSNSSDKQTRIADINRLIHYQLFEAEQHLEQLIPVKRYMQFFRNAGILTFLIILISSGLFVSAVLSWIFGMLGLISILYFNRGSLSGLLDNLKFYLQQVVFNYSFMIAVVALSAYLFAYVLSIFYQVQNVNFLWIVSFSLFLGYRMVYIFLTPHFDMRFTGNPNIPLWIKIIWGIGEFLSILGFIFSQLRLLGGAAFMGIGLTILANVFLLISVYYVKGWLKRIAIGIFIGLALVASMFKILHLPSSEYLLFPALGLFIMIVGFWYFQSNSIHKLIKGYTIGVLLVMGFFNFLYNDLKTAFYLHSTNIEDIRRFNHLWDLDPNSLEVFVLKEKEGYWLAENFHTPTNMVLRRIYADHMMRLVEVELGQVEKSLATLMVTRTLELTIQLDPEIIHHGRYKYLKRYLDKN